MCVYSKETILFALIIRFIAPIEISYKAHHKYPFKEGYFFSHGKLIDKTKYIYLKYIVSISFSLFLHQKKHDDEQSQGHTNKVCMACD